VVDERGLKLDDPVEDELEALIFRADELAGPDNAGLGREIDARASLETVRHVEIAARCANDAKVRSTAPTARPARWRRASSPVRCDR
jgi:hypothetical protein